MSTLLFFYIFICICWGGGAYANIFVSKNPKEFKFWSRVFLGTPVFPLSIIIFLLTLTWEAIKFYIECYHQADIGFKTIKTKRVEQNVGHLSVVEEVLKTKEKVDHVTTDYFCTKNK